MIFMQSGRQRRDKLGYKSRGGWLNEWCFRGDCIHHGTSVCKNCIRFDMYVGARKDNNDVQRMPKQDLPQDRKAVSGDGTTDEKGGNLRS